MFRALMFHLRALWQRPRVARELDDELRFHLEMEIAKRVREGRSPQQARRAALIDMGGIDQTQEAVRDVRAFWLDVLRQDVRFALRTFRRDRAFTATAILTLAVAIGATASTFGIVDGILFRPLPYGDPDRIMMLMSIDPKTGTLFEGLRQEQFTALRRSKSFEAVASYSMGAAGWLTTSGGGAAERLMTAEVSSAFLPVLGIQPALGRHFVPDDGRNGEVALLTRAVWLGRYGGDPNIVGKTLTFQEGPVTVAGVLPAGFWYPRTTAKAAPDVLLARPIDWDTPSAAHEVHFLLGRLRTGVSVGEAQAEANVISPRAAVPARRGRTGGIHVAPLRTQMVFALRESLMMVLGAVLLLLLIASVNVANLLLARGRARAAEFAVRNSLGADRGRLVRQLLTESVVLALAGGGCGILASFWTFRLLRARIPPALLVVRDVVIDHRVLGFSLAATLATTLVFGLVPALGASHPDISAALRPGSTGRSRRGNWSRSALLVAETAIAMVLLAGGGLLVNSLVRLRSVDVGFDTRDIVAATTVLPAKRYPAARAMQFYDEATDTLAATPGVEAVATADIEPLTTAILEAPVRAAGRPDDRADTLRVSRAYFDVLHIARLKGRLFDRNDERDGAAVAVVSESMARRFWGDADPVGQRIVVWKNVTAQIVGVVADVRCGLRNPRTGARQPARPTVYVPYDAAYRRTGARTFLVRVSPSAGNVGPALRAQLAALDPDLFVSPVPLDQLREDALVTPSFYTLVLTVFASVGLVLAGIGIAGVSAQNVVRRRHEIGVRLALGATASQVVAQVTRETIGPAVIGLVLGLAAAGALTRSLAALLFEVEARDPATFAAVAVLLVGVAVAASYVSARRAAKLDPIAVLRAN